MEREQLSLRLREMYDAAADGDKHLAPLLFGIRYADQISACGSSAKILAETADIPGAYGSEVQKGIRLSEHVELKSSSSPARSAEDEGGSGYCHPTPPD